MTFGLPPTLAGLLKQFPRAQSAPCPCRTAASLGFSVTLGAALLTPGHSRISERPAGGGGGLETAQSQGCRRSSNAAMVLSHSQWIRRSPGGTPVGALVQANPPRPLGEVGGEGGDCEAKKQAPQERSHCEGASVHTTCGLQRGRQTTKAPLAEQPIHPKHQP